MSAGAQEPTAPPAVETRNVTRTLDLEVPVTLVRDVTVKIAAGEYVSITGPSGSGKSSLLYLLGLLDTPSEGEVWIEGTATSQMTSAELAALRLAKVGFVFQFHFLLPEFSVMENVMIPMRRLGRLAEREMKDRAETLLTDLGLGDHLRKNPDQLSGGQRQRVAIARALANEPSIVLADEPTGSLDQKSSSVVSDIFARLSREMGKTVIMVTHDRDMAADCDRRIHLVDGMVVSGGLGSDGGDQPEADTVSAGA